MTVDRVESEKKKLNISTIKLGFVKKFPNEILTSILLQEPDEMTSDELIGAIGVWLTICDLESNKNEKDRVNKEGF